MNYKAKHINKSKTEAIALDVNSFAKLVNLPINIIILLGINIILSIIILILR